MSIEAAMSRIDQIQAMLAAVAARARARADHAPASRARSRARPATSTAPRRSRAGAPTTTAAATGASALPAGTPYAAEITAAAKANGLDPALLAGLIKQESGFNPNAGSAAGARGLTQLMPGTAAGLGVTNVLDPVQSINGGAKYLKQQLDAFGGDVTKALAAYNAGPGAVQRFGGVPPYAETQNYVRIVQANAASFRTAPPPPLLPLPPRSEAHDHRSHSRAARAPPRSPERSAAPRGRTPPAGGRLLRAARRRRAAHGRGAAHAGRTTVATTPRAPTARSDDAAADEPRATPTTTPAAEAPATEEAPASRRASSPPDLFALQLASPLPPPPRPAPLPARRPPRRPRRCRPSRRPRSSRRRAAPCRPTAEPVGRAPPPSRRAARRPVRRRCPSSPA